MYNPASLIHNLEQISSRNQKESMLLESFLYYSTLDKSAEDWQFHTLLKLCFDPFTTFGIKNIPLKTSIATSAINLDSRSYVELFISSLQRLAVREVTGNDAIALVDLLKDACSCKLLWNNWYRRILLKDLKCGVDVKTINKVYKRAFPSVREPLVTLFECQLAMDSTKHEHQMTGSKLVSVKLDGVRVLAVVLTNGEIKLYSRNGKELQNFPSIINSLRQFIKFPLEEAIVLDGEIMSSSFQDLMKQVHRKENVDTKDASYYIFDYIPLRDFQQGVCFIPQGKRVEILRELFLPILPPSIQLLENKTVDLSTPEGLNEFRVINNQAIQNHYEGLMIKDPRAPYECKRTSSWLKLKPFIDVTLSVIAVEEGTGKNVGRLGALICKGFDLDCEIEVSVGGGFSDEQRKSFWDHKDTLIGRLVEVRADNLTLNQHKVAEKIYSLRFPRFLCFRDLVKGEKL